MKSHNLLLDDTWRVKVADFGLSCTLRSSDQTSCGTPAWSAPEVLRGSACTKKSDVYSFAIVVWELLARSIPYEGKTGMEVGCFFFSFSFLFLLYFYLFVVVSHFSFSLDCGWCFNKGNETPISAHNATKMETIHHGKLGRGSCRSPIL